MRMRFLEHTSRTPSAPAKFSGPRRAGRGGLTVITLFSALLFLAASRASIAATSSLARPRYDVDATVDLTRGVVGVRERIALPDGWGAPVLWLYADRLREVPASFDEFEAERIYPAGIERGGYDEVVVTVAGCPSQRIAPTDAVTVDRATQGRDVPIMVCSAASRPLQLEVTTTLRLPARYGTLGLAREVGTLGDPWYPLVLPSSASTVPPLADHVVRVTPTDAQTVATAAGAVSVDGAHPVATVEQRAVTHAPVVVLPTDRSWTREDHAGVALTFVSDHDELQVRSPFAVDAASDRAPLDVDAAGLVHGTVRDCVRLLRRLGFVAAPADQPRARGIGDALVVVEVPLRQRLAVDLPGMLLVSDHAFRLIPFDRIRRLHGLPVARRAFDVLIAPHLLATSTRDDAPWIADADGTLLADLLLTEAARGETPSADASTTKETARDLIAGFAFHPTIDQLLYAPQVAYAATLFGVLEEPDLDRPGADRARNRAPMGRFVIEKLRDRLGDRFPEAVFAHVALAAPWRTAAQQVADHDLDYFWTQWTTAHRKVAYRIADVKSGPTDGGARTTIQIERLGETAIREPVAVEVIDDDGNRVRAIWDAAGARGQLEVVTPAPFEDARLDPDQRLSQDPSLADGHPRFDDETSHAWKPPVFGGFTLAYTPTEQRLDIDAAFVMRRRFDLDRGWAFHLTNDARGYGSTVQRIFNFGAMRDLNSRFGTFMLGLGANRSPHGFGSEPSPVSQGSILTSIGWNTVRQLQDPLTGYGATFALRANLAREDGGGTTPNVAVVTRGHLVLWEELRTASVIVAGAGVVLGHALDTQLLGLGGRTTLRSYEADQSLGRAQLFAIFEQRWRALQGLYLDEIGAGWTRAIELAPWLAGGVVSTRESAVTFTRQGLLAEVGVGLRILHDWAGIQPGVIVLDVGVPLLRPDSLVRDAQGTVVHQRQRVGVWFGFEQVLW